MTLEQAEKLLEAVRTIHKLYDLGDAVYVVRSRAVENGDGFNGNSWEHPDVVAYSEAVEVVREVLADNPCS